MNVKYAFEAVDMGDEFILVPVGDGAKEIHGVIRTNAAGNRIIQMLLQGMNEEEIIRTLSKEYDNDSASLADYVRKVIQALQNMNFIE